MDNPFTVLNGFKFGVGLVLGQALVKGVAQGLVSSFKKNNIWPFNDKET